MNKGLIERLAEEAGARLKLPSDEATYLVWEFDQDAGHLERFVAFVAEECAKICDERRHDTMVLTSMPPQSAAAYSAAQKIRATFKRR